MGSVMSDIECNNCKSPNCMEDFYYKSGKVYEFCPDCGYSHSFTLKRDNEGKVIEIDGKWQFDEKEVKNPFGAFRLYNKGGTTGTIDTKENFDKFIEEIQSELSILEEATFSQFINGKIVKTNLKETIILPNQ